MASNVRKAIQLYRRIDYPRNVIGNRNNHKGVVMKYIATSNENSIRGLDKDCIVLFRGTLCLAERELRDLLKERENSGDVIVSRTVRSFETDKELGNSSPLCNTSDQVQSRSWLWNEAYKVYWCNCTKCKGFAWIRRAR